LISEEAYFRIRKTIGYHAIEDIFCTEETVQDLVNIETGVDTADDIIKRYKKEWLKEKNE